VAVVLAAALVACFSSLELGSTSQPIVTTNYTTYDFGAVPLGMQVFGPVGSAFVVSPQGPSDDDNVTQISFDTSCPAFGLSLPPPLGSGGTAHVYNLCTGSGSVGSTTAAAGSASCNPVTYSFNATFKPSTSPQQSCVVRIYTTSNVGGGSGSATITLFGSGQANQYSWDVQPTNLGFGSVPVSTTSAPQTVTINNTGTSPFTVNMSNTNPAVFNVTSLTSTTIGPGSGLSYGVTCDPPAATTYNADHLTFSTSAAEGGLSQAVALSCTGVSSKIITTPNPVDMGTHIVGDAATTIPVEFDNTGNATTVLSAFSITTAIPGELAFATAPPTSINMPAMSMQPNALRIRYTPTTEQRSGNLGTLQFMDGSTPLSIPIVGSALVASLGANPATVEFGTLCAGGSASQDVSVTTTASGAVVVSSITSPSAPFGATPTQAPPITMPGGGGSGFSITATASPTAAGDYSGKIVLHTDIPQMGQIDIPVHAAAIAGGNAPSPDALHFGAVGVGLTSPEKDVTLTNCSSAPLMVTGTHLEGADKADFVSPTVDPTPVGTHQQIKFQVFMSPHSNGTKLASLVIDNDGGSAAVMLDGNAFGGSDDGTNDRRTYYACSAGGVAAWPVGLVALVLRRRRRRSA
jgi:hypothetical protein